MKIINSIDSAITKGHWHNPGADFYNKICSNKEALKEAYLVIGENVGENVPFTRSGCKYPHHSINKDGDLVLNVAGVKAAYQRAKQMGIFSGEVKEHLMRHYKELDIYKGSQMESDKKITENFEYIESVLGIDENKYFMEWEENSSIGELSIWIDNVAHNGFDEYTEASHTRLKYCYRIGFDKDTGEEVAVQFALEPDNITNVSDKQLILNAMKLVNDKDFIEKLQKSGRNNDIKIIEKLNDTKNNIRKMGMIDFVSKAGKVINIYTKSGKQLNECNLLPLYSDSVVKYISGLKKRYGGMPTKDIFNKVEFKDDIKAICKSPISKLEYYKVGEVGGDDTYKTTLLLWDFDLFKSYRFTPMIRNHAVQGNDKDPEVALKYLKNNLNNINKTTESASFENLVEIIESLSSTEYCWGDRIDNFYYLGESYTIYDIDNPESLDKYYLNLFYNQNDRMNESFMDEYIDNYVNDDNTINELLTKMDEINYDKSIQDWRLKSPSQVWNKKLGNCHDQSLYALNSLRQLGLEVGQLFFIELNKGEKVGGNAHTLTWYQKDDKYFWFEHSWENKRGIHGPYDSIDKLKEDVYREWKSDDNINSHKYENIKFFDIPKYKLGMTLGEYIDSWTKDDIINKSTDDNDIEKQWFITSDDGADNCCIKVKGYNKPMRGRSSMITLKHMLGEWYVMSKRNNGGDYGVPGGGWDKDEDPMDAAIRELHEEVQCNISNVRRMGTLIEYHEDVAQWVKDHVPEKDWWYGYYSAIFVGVYAGVFKGEVEDRDKETGYSFKPLKVVIDRFPKEYQDAIIKYIDNKYYQESVFTEPDGNDIPELNKQEESMNDNINEASHGKLKYDFRIGWDYNTGHMIKVVYSLDNIDITDIGNFYYSTHNVSKEQHMDYVKNNITKKGNPDHQSRGQKVLAIVDLVTNKNLDSVTLLAPHCDHINTHNTSQNLNDLKAAREYADKNPAVKVFLKKGEIDNTPTFKSTWFSKTVNDRKDPENFRFAQIAKTEMFKDARGWKAHNVTPRHAYMYGETQPVTTYKNPNKHQALQELYAREKDSINYLNDIKNDLKTNPSIKSNPKFIKSYNAEMHNLKIIRSDINKLENGKYDPEIMKKYRDSKTGQIIGLESVESDDIMSMFIEADVNNEETSEEKTSDENITEEPPAIEDNNSEPESSEEVQPEENSEEPPELDEPAEEPQQEEQKEEPKEEEPKKEEKPLSMPKQTDAAEKGKNGVNRKKLYIAFIEWCKEYNSKNTFGSIFDKDIFHNVYPFVPEELRYFYRLANPILCVLAGDLTFFQVSELKMINKNNPNINEMLIFAATNNDLRVFNNKDKKVYLATEENGIKLGQVLGESFDLYIQNMIKKGDILNTPLENSNEE